MSGAPFSSKSIVRYCLTPEIRPRLANLRLRLAHFTFAIAAILVSTGLLPRNHPAVSAANIGRYGVTQLLAIAANNIGLRRSDIDRLLVFCAIVLALVILVAQTAAILFSAVVSDAHAAGFFTLTPDETKRDIVMIFLDQVFGVPGVFDTGTPAVGSPVHEGVRALLAFYSRAMMIIAVIIVLYYVFIVVGESAQTGTPFGRRFNGLWAPLRLVLALGLLVPLGSGLNAAQYITLYTAKFGSAFATNAWAVFAEKFTDPASIVTAPDVEATRGLVKSIFMAEVCRQAATLPEQDPANPATPIKDPILPVQALGSTSAAIELSNLKPADMIAAARANRQESVAISWTRTHPPLPVTADDCGRVAINLNVALRENTGSVENALKTATEPMIQAYVAEISKIVTDLGDAPRLFASVYVPYPGNSLWGQTAALNAIDTVVNQAARKSTERVKGAVNNSYAAIADTKAARDLLDKMVKSGWGGAGVWYVKIGQINQKYQQAVRESAPVFTDVVTPSSEVAVGADPAMADVVRIAVQQADKFVERVKPVTPAPADVNFSEGKVIDSEEYWSKFEDRPFETMLNFVFQTETLRILRTHPTLDPMVVLVTAGDHLVQRSITLFGIGMASQIVGDAADAAAGWVSKIPFVGGAIAHALKGIGGLIKIIGTFGLATALVGFMAGVVLFYLLPLFPFIYFFFAILGWGLSIVEAIAAGPLWALAHLRIDGEGLPGAGAVTGYFLLFEIMLRPVLIVAGLIMGYTVFGAATYLLATVFDTLTFTLDDLMTTSWTDEETAEGLGLTVSGFDNFIYTIIFTAIVYATALSCFKLTDKLPDTIMRWLGAPGGTSPFAGGKDAPDIQGTVLAGGAAAATISSGLHGAFKNMRLSKRTKNPIEDNASGAQSGRSDYDPNHGGPGARVK